MELNCELQEVNHYLSVKLLLLLFVEICKLSLSLFLAATDETY